MRRLEFAPSILSADFSRLGEEIALTQQAGADRIHFDVMDGHFVPNITMGPVVIKAIRRVTDLPFDVHLMISNPDQYLEAFATAGSNVLIPHIEVCPDARRTIAAIRDLGLEAGIAISPDTPVGSLRNVAPDVKLVLVMSVYPGFSGQSFLEKSVRRVREVRELLDQTGSHAGIGIDGGVDESNVGRAVAAGATNLVAASAIYRQDLRIDEALTRLRVAAQAAL
jgi:ribulose-phosphate 3-epimerase